jgi:hypothetical protein
MLNLPALSVRASWHFQPERENQMGCLEGYWRFVPDAQSFSELQTPSWPLCILAIFVWTGKSKEEAVTDYITKVKQLLEESESTFWAMKTPWPIVAHIAMLYVANKSCLVIFRMASDAIHVTVRLHGYSSSFKLRLQTLVKSNWIYLCQISICSKV